MTAAELVRTRLLSLSPVTTLVSTRITNGLFHEQTALGAIRCNGISDIESYHLRGPENWHVARVQVDMIAATKAAVNAIAAAVHGDGLGADATGISGFVGDIGGTSVSAIFADQPREYFDADERRQWVYSRDYIVHFRGVS